MTVKHINALGIRQLYALPARIASTYTSSGSSLTCKIHHLYCLRKIVLPNFCFYKYNYIYTKVMSIICHNAQSLQLYKSQTQTLGYSSILSPSLYSTVSPRVSLVMYARRQQKIFIPMCTTSSPIDGHFRWTITVGEALSREAWLQNGWSHLLVCFLGAVSDLRPPVEPLQLQGRSTVPENTWERLHISPSKAGIKEGPQDHSKSWGGGSRCFYFFKYFLVLSLRDFFILPSYSTLFCVYIWLENKRSLVSARL